MSPKAMVEGFIRHVVRLADERLDQLLTGLRRGFPLIPLTQSSPIPDRPT
jgi:hypothetical protein